MRGGRTQRGESPNQRRTVLASLTRDFPLSTVCCNKPCSEFYGTRASADARGPKADLSPLAEGSPDQVSKQRRGDGSHRDGDVSRNGPKGL